MEKMPYQSEEDAVVSTQPLVDRSRPANDWRNGLPTLTGSLVTLRELRVSDAPALFATLTTEEVSRFISPPPSTVEGFEKFIAWTRRQRIAGQYVCFAIVPRGSATAVGLFQVRSLEPGFGMGEWGFALASEYWGTGLFMDGAQLTLNFAFTVMGVHRLEARAAVKNGRGNAALRKVGAFKECTLRRSFFRKGQYLDQNLWTILAEEFQQTGAAWGPRVIH